MRWATALLTSSGRVTGEVASCASVCRAYSRSFLRYSGLVLEPERRDLSVALLCVPPPPQPPLLAMPRCLRAVTAPHEFTPPNAF